jgi:hypothetical protein
MKIKLMKNYLGFMEKVRESSKPVLRQLYSLETRDVRTVAGTYLRNILLLTNKSTVDDLQVCQVDSFIYHQIGDTWRVGLVKELIDLKHGDLMLPEGWTAEEFVIILDFACTQ